MPINFYCPFCKMVFLYSDNDLETYQCVYQDTKIQCTGIRNVDIKLCTVHEYLKKLDFEEKLAETIDMLYDVAEMFSVTVDELNEFQTVTITQRDALSRLWKFVRLYKPINK